MTLQRVDNDRGYEPGNVVWATAAEQGTNTRASRLIEGKGKSKPLSVWAREAALKRELVRDRLRLGWTVERALTMPPRPLVRA